jgi:hypothetical protein
MSRNLLEGVDGEDILKMQYLFGCCVVFVSPKSRMDFTRRAIGYGDVAEK